MKVVVTEKAFYNRSRVYPGAVIEVPKDLKGSWFAPIGSEKAKKASVKEEVPPEPQTLSELANARAVRPVEKPAG